MGHPDLLQAEAAEQVLESLTTWLISHILVSDKKFDWIDCIHPDDRPAYLAMIQEMLATPEPGEAEYRLRRYDGHYRWFLETSASMTRTDTPPAICCLSALRKA